jgi:hypothetical protein
MIPAYELKRGCWLKEKGTFGGAEKIDRNSVQAVVCIRPSKQNPTQFTLGEVPPTCRSALSGLGKLQHCQCTPWQEEPVRGQSVSVGSAFNGVC